MLLLTKTLYSVIDSWKYIIDTNISEDDKTGRSLMLVGVTQDTDFLSSSIFDFTIVEVNESKNDTEFLPDKEHQISYCDITWNKYRLQKKVTKRVQATAPFSKQWFESLLKMLFQWDSSTKTQLGMELELYGFGLDMDAPSDNWAVEWPRGKVLSVKNIKFVLHSSKWI